MNEYDIKTTTISSNTLQYVCNSNKDDPNVFYRDLYNSFS